MTNKEYLTTNEVAKLFGVTPMTVRNWTDSGELICEKTIKGHRRFTKADTVHAVESAKEKEEKAKKAKALKSKSVFAAAMRKIWENPKHGDVEQPHIDADDLMCQLLRALGYGEGIDIFEDAYKADTNPNKAPWDSLTIIQTLALVKTNNPPKAKAEPQSKVVEADEDLRKVEKSLGAILKKKDKDAYTCYSVKPGDTITINGVKHVAGDRPIILWSEAGK